MPLSAGAAAGIGAAVSAISAGGSMISAGIKNRKMWKYRQREMALQQKYALEQMQAQYDFNKKMWDESNKYNDPSAIFERFRKAGINPAGVLGSSGASMQASFPMDGNVSSPGLGPSTAGDVSTPDFSGAGVSGVQTALSAYAANSEVELNKASANRAQAEADRARADADSIRNSTHEAGFQKLFDNAQLALTRAQEKHELSLAEYTSTQNALMSFDLIVRQWTVGGEIDSVLAEYQSKINAAKAGNIQNEYLRSQLDSQLLLTWSMFQSNMADASYKSQLASLTASQIIDLQNEISNNWDKRWELTDASGNKKVYSLKDLFGMLTLADVEAAAWKPAQAEQAAGKAAAEKKNEENRWKFETLHAVTSIIQTLMFRSGMRGFGSSTNTVGTDIGTDTSSQSSRTTILDASGNPKGYVIREMSGTRNSSSARNSQSQTNR